MLGKGTKPAIGPPKPITCNHMRGIKLGINQANIVVCLHAMGKIDEENLTCSVHVSCSCHIMCCPTEFLIFLRNLIPNSVFVLFCFIFP